MPRFSIKNLLVATALIAVGCGMMWTAIHLPKVYFPDDVARNMSEKVFLWFGGGGLIGAGIGTPLGNWYIGRSLC